MITPNGASTVLVDSQIKDLLDNGVITRGLDNLEYLVNPASLDITLGNEFMLERDPPLDRPTVLLNTWEDSSEPMYYRIEAEEITLAPGESCLAVSREKFNMPDTLLGEYILKSRLARFGLDHKIAGYIDPGFHGHLTLEIINSNRHTHLRLKEGQRIGQIKFTRLGKAPDAPYAGHYSGFGVSAARALKVCDSDPSILIKRL